MVSLRDSIIKHEGKVTRADGRHMPYRDSVGKLTIGYGRNLDDMGITDYEASVMLDHDLAVCQAELIKAHPALLHNDSLSDERKKVLFEMAFNMGVPRLLGFKKMWAALEAHDYSLAALEMLDSAWARQVGMRAIMLADIMSTGKEKK